MECLIEGPQEVFVTILQEFSYILQQDYNVKNFAHICVLRS